jgi:hypothetical protein
MKIENDKYGEIILDPKHCINSFQRKHMTKIMQKKGLIENMSVTEKANTLFRLFDQ